MILPCFYRRITKLNSLICLAFFLCLAGWLQAQPLSEEPLTVAVYDSPPFGMISKSGKFHGMMVELWEDVAKDMGLEYYDYHYVYITDIQQLQDGLQKEEFDLGIGAIPITPGKELLMDFSCSISPSGIGVGVSRARLTVSFFDKWAPIFLDLATLLFFLLLMLFASAFIVYIVETRFQTGIATEKNISSIADGLWWAAVTMTTVGYGDKVPMSNFGKVLGIIWIFTGIIFSRFLQPVPNWEIMMMKVTSDQQTI